MPQHLRNLTISEVSLVDAGANAGARVVLFKSRAALAPEVEAYLKREFSDDKRKELAGSGAALPDGSFPIENTGDLENAIRAIGRAKDPDKAKAHIIARAKTLGASDKIPETWHVEKALAADVAQALDMLKTSAVEIATSKAADKPGLIAKSIAEFGAYLNALFPSALKKAYETKDADPTGEHDMTEAEMKAKEEADKKEREEAKKALDAATAALAKAKTEIAMLKMSEKHKAHAETLSGDEKDKFMAMSPSERDDCMEKSIAKSIPEHIRKELDEARETRKRLEALEKARELESFEKRAADIGLPANQGALLQKAYAGDRTAIDKLVGTIETLGKQVEAGALFKEFGGAGSGASDDPVAKMEATVAEVQKADPKLTRAQAVAKIAEMPGYSDVWKAYKAASNRQAA